MRLEIREGPADPLNTAHFTQMEANMALFFGLAFQAWSGILIPDDTPFDRFMDANPNEFLGPGFVPDANPDVPGVQPAPLEGGLTERQLFGFDLFTGGNHSGRNPFHKTMRCGQCHVGPELTDHSMSASFATFLGDPITGKPKVITGFLLEEELGETAQDAVEIDNLSFGLDFETMLPTFGQDINGFPTGHALLDNGIYNIGVRPIMEDISRGGDDPFGFPLSLATLALINVGAPVGVAGLDPATTITELFAEEVVFDPSTGTFVPTGLVLPAGLDVAFTPHLPDHLTPWANDLPVGEAWPLIDRTIFHPDRVDDSIAVSLVPAGSYPNPNRVGKNGNFKAPQLRNVELTGPYFHNGGMLTLRQVIDFYARGGDFPASNTEHRDPHIVNLNQNFFSQFTETEKAALVDFLLALTDERVKYERAPFDRPEMFVPINGSAPDNPGGRAWLLNDARFLQIPEVGAEGRPDALPNFLGISSVEGSAGPDHFDSLTPFGLQNTAPVAAPNEYQVEATRTLAVVAPGVLENDNDGEGHPFTAMLVSGPAGDLTLNPNGSFTYRYPVNIPETGTDTFTYKVSDGLIGNTTTVTIIVTPRASNEVPIASNNTHTVQATVPLLIAAPGVLGNDFDADGDVLSAILVSGPTHAGGRLTLNADGSFAYTNVANLTSPAVDTFTYAVSDGVSTGNTATVTITVNPRVITLAEALESPLVWTTGGHSNWVTQTTNTHDNADAAQSGRIGHSQESWIQTIVTGPGTLTFWWKVSSESSNDRLRFYLNGSEQFGISGTNNGWLFRTVSLSSGTKTLRWRYNKNSSTVRGLDRGFLDQVTFTPPAPPTPPTITTAPTNQTVAQGTTVVFNSAATGGAPLTYRWQRNGTNLVNGGNVSGATTPTLTLTAVQAAQAGTYTVVVTNLGGTATASASLTVTPPVGPTIVSQPVSQTVGAGSTVTFNVGATGSAPLSYRWRRNGVALVNGNGISGATTATLTIANVQDAHEGNYSVLVSNAVNTATSSNATLTVLSLGDALDAPGLVWTTEGDGLWNSQTTTNHDGVDAARSGPIDQDEESVLETTVVGPGTISFWWKVSSELDEDFLTFYIDDNDVAEISGESGWTFRSFAVPSGTQVLRWIYSKNGGGVGLDAGWVDQVQFTPTP